MRTIRESFIDIAICRANLSRRIIVINHGDIHLLTTLYRELHISVRIVVVTTGIHTVNEHGQGAGGRHLNGHRGAVAAFIGHRDHHISVLSNMLASSRDLRHGQISIRGTVVGGVCLHVGTNIRHRVVTRIVRGGRHTGGIAGRNHRLGGVLHRDGLHLGGDIATEVGHRPGTLDHLLAGTRTGRCDIRICVVHIQSVSRCAVVCLHRNITGHGQDLAIIAAVSLLVNRDVFRYREGRSGGILNGNHLHRIADRDVTARIHHTPYAVEMVCASAILDRILVAVGHRRGCRTVIIDHRGCARHQSVGIRQAIVTCENFRINRFGESRFDVILNEDLLY